MFQHNLSIKQEMLAHEQSIQEKVKSSNSVKLHKKPIVKYRTESVLVSGHAAMIQRCSD